MADRRVIGIETVSSWATDDLGYTVEVKRLWGGVGSRPEAEPVTPRVTAGFRRADGAWHLLHRHADPAVVVQLPEWIVGWECRLP